MGYRIPVGVPAIVPVMVTELRRYRDLLADGVSRGRINRLSNKGDIVRVGRGIYGLADADRDDCLRALFLRLPPGAALGFQSAAAVYGFGTAPGPTVHVVVPAGTVRPRIQSVRVHEAVVPVADAGVLDGIPCVPAARCAVDLARTVRRIDALPVLDAALRSRTCSPADLAAEVLRHDGLRGVRQARELVPLADPRPECRQESQVRLIVIDSGLPAPEPQLWVYDDYGAPRYRLDLGYEQYRVGLEYDGMSHVERSRMCADRDRMNWLDAHGWTMRYFTDQDLYRRPSYIVAQVRSALAVATA